MSLHPSQHPSEPQAGAELVVDGLTIRFVPMTKRAGADLPAR